MSSDHPEPALLAGGNPKIPKGDGREPVRRYLEAMPGWKGDVGRRLDELVRAAVPDVRYAVRWNSPFYGVEGNGWFASFHCFTRYVKLTFFDGSGLDPLPPERGKDDLARYVHLGEHDEIDANQLTSWFEQAARAPGWNGF